MPRKMCLHCEAYVGGRPRGLCWKCYYDPEISRLYPSANQSVVVRCPRRLPEPTVAEPGTPEKITVLRQRVADREHLWHPADRKASVV